MSKADVIEVEGTVVEKLPNLKESSLNLMDGMQKLMQKKY